MSYDLYVYRTPSGRDPSEILEEIMEVEEEEAGDVPTNDADLDWCEEEFERVLGGDASWYRCGSHLSVNVPYGNEGPEAHRVFSGLTDVLQRACEQHGLTVYDPQEDRVLDPRRDLQSMLATSDRGTNILRDIHAERVSIERQGNASYGFTVEEKKPWWRFW